MRTEEYCILYLYRIIEIKDLTQNVFSHPVIISTLEQDIHTSRAELEMNQTISLEEYVTRRTKIEMQEELLKSLQGGDQNHKTSTTTTTTTTTAIPEVVTNTASEQDTFIGRVPSYLSHSEDHNFFPDQ